jgi:hypothetical protein
MAARSGGPNPEATGASSRKYWANAPGEMTSRSGAGSLRHSRRHEYSPRLHDRATHRGGLHSLPLLDCELALEHLADLVLSGILTSLSREPLADKKYSRDDMGPETDRFIPMVGASRVCTVCCCMRGLRPHGACGDRENPPETARSRTNCQS